MRPQIMFSVLCLLVACSSTVPNRNQQVSMPDRPKWVDNPISKDTQRHKAFVGISGRYSSEVRAREDAKINAWGSVIEQIGLFAEKNIRQVLSQTGDTGDVLSPAIVSDEVTRVTAKGMVVGEPVEYHTQHWRSPGGVAAEEWYQSYVLFLVKKDFLLQAQVEAIENLKRGMDQSRKDSLTRAQRLLDSTW